MSRPPQCLKCKHADWQRTAAGKLHPSGDGRCRWAYPTVRLPISFYTFGGSDKPHLGGGNINRRDEWKQCPQFQPISKEHQK